MAVISGGEKSIIQGVSRSYFNGVIVVGSTPKEPIVPVINLIENGTFTGGDSTGWTPIAPWTFTNDKLEAVAATTLMSYEIPTALIPGDSYTVTFDLDAQVSGVRIRLGDNVNQGSFNTPGLNTHTFTLVAGATDNKFRFDDDQGAFTGSIDNIVLTKDAPLILVSATIENSAPNDIVMVFNQSVTMTNLVSNGFTFNTVGYGGLTPQFFTSISGSGTTWTGIIATGAIHNETYRLDYSSTTGDVVNAGGGNLATFTGSSIANNTQSTEADNFVGSESIYTPQSGGSVVYLDINAADDTGDGSIGNPYKDITQTLISSTTRIDAGDVLVIRGGTYPTTARLGLLGIFGQDRTTIAERIVVQNYPGEIVIIDGTNVIWSQPDNDAWMEGVLSMGSRGHYDIIDGIQIHNSQKIGIYVNSKHCSVLNSKTYRTGASGIYVTSSDNVVIDNNEIELGTYLGDQEMITIYGSSNITISNNHIHHWANENEHENGLGIDIKNGGFNIEIVGNTVHDVRSHAIYVDSRGDTNGIKIHGNEVYNIQANGIQIATEVWTTGDPIANDIKIYNNLVHDIGSTGIRIGYADRTYNYFYNMDVVNNTVYNIGNVGISYDLNADGNHTANNIRISNNILRATGAINSEHPPIYKATTDPGVDIIVDTNILDRNVGDVGDNPTIADPLFVDEANANFRLDTGSPAIDTGIENVNIYQPTTDYDGNPRVVNSIIDMGAFEKQ